MKNVPFEVKINDKVLNLETCQISNKIRQESDKYANLAFQKAVDDGFLLQIQVDNLLKDSGFDFDKLASDAEQIRRELKEKEKQLYSGRIGSQKLTKLEGRKLALEMRKLRSKIYDMSDSVTRMYSKTAEKKAESERLAYFMYACTLDSNTGKPYFKSFEEFKNDSSSEIAIAAAKNFNKMITGDSESVQELDPEDKWLRKYNFTDENNNLINKDGKLCDENFNIIDENLRYIDNEGNFLDEFGNKVDKNGNLIIEEYTYTD